MNDIWEESWEVIDETFRQLAVSLGAQYPKMYWTSGHNDNQAFPFRAYAAFRQSRQGDDDVVASVDFLRSDDELRFSADIGCDDGTVLADGPSGIIDIRDGVLSARHEIEIAVGSIVRFLKASEKTLSGAMSHQRTDGPSP